MMVKQTNSTDELVKCLNCRIPDCISRCSVAHVDVCHLLKCKVTKIERAIRDLFENVHSMEDALSKYPRTQSLLSQGMQRTLLFSIIVQR